MDADQSEIARLETLLAEPLEDWRAILAACRLVGAYMAIGERTAALRIHDEHVMPRLEQWDGQFRIVADDQVQMLSGGHLKHYTPERISAIDALFKQHHRAGTLEQNWLILAAWLHVVVACGRQGSQSRRASTRNNGRRSIHRAAIGSPGKDQE